MEGKQISSMRFSNRIITAFECGHKMAQQHSHVYKIGQRVADSVSEVETYSIKYVTDPRPKPVTSTYVLLFKKKKPAVRKHHELSI